MLDTLLEEELYQWQWGYINKTGQVVLTLPVGFSGRHFDHGVAAVEQNGQWSSVDRHGIIHTPQPFRVHDTTGAPISYTARRNVAEGLTAIQYRERWGYANEQGRVVIPMIFTSAGDFSEGLAGVCMDVGCGYIHAAGQFVIPPEFSDPQPFVNGQACVLVDKGTHGDPHPDGKFGTMDANSRHWRVPAQIDRSGRIVEWLIQGSCKEEDVSHQQGPFRAHNVIGMGESIRPHRSRGKAKNAEHPVTIGTAWCYLDATGQYAIPPQTEHELRLTEALGATRDSAGQWRYMITPRFDSAFPFSEGLAAAGIFTRKGRPSSLRYGYIDRTGEYIIPPQFSYVKNFRQGFAKVSADMKTWHSIDRGGRTVATPPYQIDGPFSDGLAVAHMGEQKWTYGFVDFQGRIAIPFQFDGAGDFSEGLAPVKMHGKWKWGYIDRRGNMVIPPRFDSASSFSEGLAVKGTRFFPADGGWGYEYIDWKGNTAIRHGLRGFARAEPFSDGVASVAVWEEQRKNYRTGFIDKRGKWVEPPPVRSPRKATEADFTLIRADSKTGYLDETGQIIKSQLDRILGFSDGRPVEVWGLLDARGSFVSPPLFKTVHDQGRFSEGFLAVQVAAVRAGWEEVTYDGVNTIPEPLGGRWGYVNHDGVFVIEPHFDGAWEFSEGLAAVKVGKWWGFIDTTGRMVIAPRFPAPSTFSEGLAAVKLRRFKRR
jgi:hypothetical protein